MKKAEKFDQMIDQVITDRVTRETVIYFMARLQIEIQEAERTNKKTLNINKVIEQFQLAHEQAKKDKAVR